MLYEHHCPKEGKVVMKVWWHLQAQQDEQGHRIPDSEFMVYRCQDCGAAWTEDAQGQHLLEPKA